MRNINIFLLDKEKIMEPLKIKIFLFGTMPFEINLERIKKWHSSLFKIDEIKTIKDEERIFLPDGALNSGAGIDISKQTIELILNKFEFIRHDELININLIVGYIDLGDNWFLCSLKDFEMSNTIILSYQQIYDELVRNNIPLENLILSALYTYSIIFLKNSELPTRIEEEKIMHLDTRGCLFDFTNDVTDVKFYTNYPIICTHCQKEILCDDINLKKINKELQRIRKTFFYRLYENIKNNILIYVLLTSCFSALLTKATTSSTYINLFDIVVTCVLGVLSVGLLTFVIIRSKISKRNRYSHNKKLKNSK